VPLQNRPSLQAALFAVCLQVFLSSSQVSVVHAIPSSQFTGVPGWHPPLASHVSRPLQNRASLQLSATVMSFVVQAVQGTFVPLSRTLTPTVCVEPSSTVMQQGWSGRHPESPVLVVRSLNPPPPTHTPPPGQSVASPHFFPLFVPPEQTPHTPSPLRSQSYSRFPLPKVPQALFWAQIVTLSSQSAGLGLAVSINPLSKHVSLHPRIFRYG
jgi:hypothetical protein